MKFYEFETGEFTYYALIGANNVEDAKICYILYIYEINDYDGEPAEVSEEMVLSIFEKFYTVDNDMYEKFEYIKSEFEYIKSAKEPYLLLVDDAIFSFEDIIVGGK